MHITSSQPTDPKR